MQNLKQIGWLASLAEVEESIQGCQHLLNQYEATFQKVLGDKVPQSNPSPVVTKLHSDQPNHWEEILDPAVVEQQDLDSLLIEQEQLWKHWQDRLRLWQKRSQLPNND